MLFYGIDSSPITLTLCKRDDLQTGDKQGSLPFPLLQSPVNPLHSELLLTLMSEHFHKYRRGGYAGHKFGGGQSAPALSSLPPERSLTEGLHPIPVKTLARPTSQQISNNVVAVKNLEYIGSFNWTNATKPTVIIPGPLHHGLTNAF